MASHRQHLGVLFLLSMLLVAQAWPVLYYRIVEPHNRLQFGGLRPFIEHPNLFLAPDPLEDRSGLFATNEDTRDAQDDDPIVVATTVETEPIIVPKMATTEQQALPTSSPVEPVVTASPEPVKESTQAATGTSEPEPEEVTTLAGPIRRWVYRIITFRVNFPRNLDTIDRPVDSSEESSESRVLPANSLDGSDQRFDRHLIRDVEYESIEQRAPMAMFVHRMAAFFSIGFLCSLVYFCLTSRKSSKDVALDEPAIFKTPTIVCINKQGDDKQQVKY